MEPDETPEKMELTGKAMFYTSPARMIAKTAIVTRVAKE